MHTPSTHITRVFSVRNAPQVQIVFNHHSECATLSCDFPMKTLRAPLLWGIQSF